MTIDSPAAPPANAKPRATPAAIARYSPWLVGWFQWYLRRFLPKNFHALGLAEESLRRIEPIGAGDPVVGYLNHASWYDPLVVMMLAERMTPGRRVFAPFDAAALAKYPMFERMGFFGVDQGSRRGAAEFLRTAQSALAQPDASVWLTPEGRFCDPRDRAAEFEPGLAHLASKLASTGAGGWFVPLAIEYPFWEESKPEAIALVGEPVRVADHATLDKPAWQELLETRLRSAQAELAELSIARRAEAFEVVLGGAAGVGGVYEWFRRGWSLVTGKRYEANHGEKLRG